MLTLFTSRERVQKKRAQDRLVCDSTAVGRATRGARQRAGDIRGGTKFGALSGGRIRKNLNLQLIK